MNWYADVFRKMHFDMHTPGSVEGVAAEFDAHKLADNFARIGVEAICWFAKCAYGWAYYPTAVGRRHPHLAHDIFPEAVETCHARGIRVLGYYHVSGCQWGVQDHPEWYARNPDGSIETWGEHAAANFGICPLGPSGDELVIPQLVEIVTMQPADGLFLDDLLGWKTCYCDACREGFGAPLPRSPQEDGWDEYLAWRREASMAFFARAAAAVHAQRPDAVFGVNYAGSFRHPDLIPEGTGYLTADVDETESSSFNASLLNRQFARQSIPHDAMNSRMLHWWQDWTQKPVTAMKQEFATVLANGGRLFLGDISYHRTAMPDPAVLENAGEAFAFAREIEPYVRGAEPVPDIAVLNSAQSHYLQTRGPNADPPAVKGAHLALLEAGLYAHVLREEDLPTLLADYRCLVIPEQWHLSDASLAAIRDFVKAGGGLVVAGKTQLHDVLGLEDQGVFDGDRHYLVTGEADLGPSDEANCPPRLAHGITARVEALSAEVLGQHIAPLAGSPPHSGPPPSDPSGHPAITLNRHGRGRAAFVALPVATDLWLRGHSALAPILPGLVRRVSTPLLQVEAEAPLEATLLRRDNSWFVHLVNYTVSRNPCRPQVMDRIAPATDVRIRLHMEGEPDAVEGVPGGAQWWREGEDIVVMLQRVDIWACVDIRLG